MMLFSKCRPDESQRSSSREHEGLINNPGREHPNEKNEKPQEQKNQPRCKNKPLGHIEIVSEGARKSITEAK